MTFVLSRSRPGLGTGRAAPLRGTGHRLGVLEPSVGDGSLTAEPARNIPSPRTAPEDGTDLPAHLIASGVAAANGELPVRVPERPPGPPP
jgi:hypothetical protein